MLLRIPERAYWSLLAILPLLAASACGSGAMAAAGAAPALAESGAQILDTVWLVEEIRGEALGQVERMPDLLLDSESGRVVGNLGCNSMTGSYLLEGAELNFSQMAMTMRACAEGMELESRTAKALGEVAGWRIEGDQLLFLDASGSVVLRLAEETVDTGAALR